MKPLTILKLFFLVLMVALLPASFSPDRGLEWSVAACEEAGCAPCETDKCKLIAGGETNHQCNVGKPGCGWGGCGEHN